MESLLNQVSNAYQKPAVLAVRSGDSVKVHQRIKEGNKQRVQVFEGLVIRVDRKQSLTYRITVRRVASGVGVEKSFIMHSPSIEKVEIIKRAKVRRNYLSYIRKLTGKSARLKSSSFNRAQVNTPKPTAFAPVAETPAPEPKTKQPAAAEVSQDQATPDQPAEDVKPTADNQPEPAESSKQESTPDKPAKKQAKPKATKTPVPAKAATKKSPAKDKQ